MLFSNEFPFYFLWMGNPFDTQAMIRILSGLVMYGTYGWKRCVICRCHWDPIWFYPSGWCNNRVGQVSCSLDSFQVITEFECPSDRIEYNEATSEKEKFFEKKISWITLAIEALFLSHTFTVFFSHKIHGNKMGLLQIRHWKLEKYEKYSFTDVSLQVKLLSNLKLLCGRIKTRTRQIVWESKGAFMIQP